MKNRIAALSLTLALSIGLCVPAFAANNDFNIENKVLSSYHGPGGDVTIPDGVTTIAAGAFKDCENITSVTIPEGVTTIGNHAFDRCTNLTNVTIPESVTTISEGLFDGCTNLTSVTIPRSVTSIGPGAFMFCENLSSINIPSRVTAIYGSTFAYCKSLTSITIPDSVVVIGGGAFSYCENLTSVSLPKDVKILEGAFSHTPWQTRRITITVAIFAVVILAIVVVLFVLNKRGVVKLPRFHKMTAPVVAPDKVQTSPIVPKSRPKVEDIFMKTGAQTTTHSPQFCPHCGKPLAPSVNFCPECGRKLKDGEG